MKQKLKKIISTGCIFTMIFSNNVFCTYAEDSVTAYNPASVQSSNNTTRASDYIVAYSGTLTKSGNSSIYLSSKLSVSEAGCKIEADIYKDGKFYNSYYKKSSAEDMAFTKTLSVPTGSYYVKYTYYAMVNGMAVESRTKTTSTVTI